MKFDAKLIGRRIYITRINKNLTQSDICKALHIGQSTYSKLENGKYNNLNIEIINQLSDFFDVSVTWLSGLDVYDDLTEYETLLLEEFKNYLKSKRNRSEK